MALVRIEPGEQLNVCTVGRELASAREQVDLVMDKTHGPMGPPNTVVEEPRPRPQSQQPKDDFYGLWTHVEKRRHCSNVASRVDNKVRDVPISSRGSRFVALAISEGEGHRSTKRKWQGLELVTETLSDVGDHGQNIIRKASLEVNDKVSDVAGWDMVVVTCTSLMSRKHTLIHVIEGRRGS
ncbi:hypothetical protein V6N11_073427 [Hibiscus sabdariffa]|uniref:Uncharacterized protein n=1 Tax=Hibiscus sabdariffa TaxID=183260 RepID=A0ABR2N9J0_9ROSI